MLLSYESVNTRYLRSNYILFASVAFIRLLFIIHHKSHIMYSMTHLANIFKTSCIPIIVHSSVTFGYYYNLSVTEDSPYHFQLLFHTLYSLASLKITFLPSERLRKLHANTSLTIQPLPNDAKKHLSALQGVF